MKNKQTQKVTHNKTHDVKAKKVYIESLNENITTEDIYELFRLKSTAHIHQTSRVDLEMFRKTDKNLDIRFIIVLEHVRHSGKPYGNCEEARLHSQYKTCSGIYDQRLIKVLNM